MNLKTAEFFGVFLTSLVTGVFWGTWFTLTRYIDTFSPYTFMAIGQKIIRNVAVPMSILMLADLLAILICIWLLRNRRTITFYLYIFSFLFMVAALLITLLAEVPIDNQIKIWTIKTFPPQWSMLRQKWSFYHTMRTFISLFSLILFILGILAHARKWRRFY